MMIILLMPATAGSQALFSLRAIGIMMSASRNRSARTSICSSENVIGSSTEEEAEEDKTEDDEDDAESGRAEEEEEIDAEGLEVSMLESAFKRVSSRY